ncbi:hypothetical protein FHR75_004369 [Kineococcus radiotolerans]|uniref:Uncharacterized protein n=1 Tax=Kineococcus radiotolerans TaxID=131568 RepID=A0A7W4XZF7_KINRA|nr:hypothetical protein [Kineococcus radiotolerans]MBB2903527.1 hypothetical protein [Kineococcus radiotolerans]
MTFENHLHDLGAAPFVADLVRDLATTRTLRTERQQDYVSVSPSPIGAIAVFAHRHRLEIAVRPELANVALVDVPGAELRKPTTATTYLVVREPVCERSREAVLRHAAAALDWRAGGPARSTHSQRRVTAAAEATRPVCPACNYEITPSGACGC